jgi:hypothetical protein
VYLAPAADAHAVHQRPMNFSLVPLMVGAVVFGYLGAWLQGQLSATLGESEVLPGPITLVGVLAFALGAIGFGLAWYFTGRAALQPARDERESSYRPDGWVRAIAAAGYAAALGLSRIHSGLLPRYALGSLVGLAVIVLARVVAR